MSLLKLTMSYSIGNDLLTVKEVSTFLKLSVLTVYKYIKERRLEAIEFGGHYRIEKSALSSFIKKHRIKNKALDSTPSDQTSLQVHRKSNIVADSNNEE